MRFETGTIPQNLISAVLAGALSLGLAACDQQQNPPPARFGKNFEILPPDGKSASSGAGPQSAVPVDIPDPNDAELASRVITAISAEPALKSVAVAVVAKDGVVTLKGVADSHAKSNRAVELAISVDGVYSVKNEMVVVQGS